MTFEVSPLGVLALGLWLDELERCPECGSTTTHHRRGAPPIRDCRDCGIWFNPFDPRTVQTRRQAIKDTFRGMQGA